MHPALYLRPSFIDVVYYHKNCTDGAMAAAVALLYATTQGKKIEVRPFGYSDHEAASLPDMLNESVLFIDVALTKAKLAVIKTKCKRLIVLDHHISAMDELNGTLGCFFETNKSGCVMAWEYFLPTCPIPEMLLYIQQRDLWAMSETAKAFTAYFYSLPVDPFDYAAFLTQSPYLVSAWLDNCIEQGKRKLIRQDEAIDRYLSQAKVARCKPFPQFRVSIVQCNDGSIVSALGAKLSEPTGIAVIWSKDAQLNKYKASLRSTHPAESLPLAKLFGGGGHVHASSFTSDIPIDELFE